MPFRPTCTRSRRLILMPTATLPGATTRRRPIRPTWASCRLICLAMTQCPGQDWRLFKSSNSSVVTAENLKVTQPRYNTKVTISSRLTSEKYARYAERYSGNATYAKLANQDVSATLTVLGTTGVEDPNAGKTIIVKAGVTGLTGNAGDSERSPESIVPLTQVPVQYDDHKTAKTCSSKCSRTPAAPILRPIRLA